MTAFEIVYRWTEPFLLPIYRIVRSELLSIVRPLTRSAPRPVRVLDVGGRKSHCTIGVPAEITVTDLPRSSEIQKRLNLGIDPEIVRQIRARRSNVRDVLLDDMTRSQLPDSEFDCVVSIEVLEHVEDDASFVREVSRVLKPGGVFLMTTPNGDFVPNVSNPDHKRHYKRKELQALLDSYFQSVDVRYGVPDGTFHSWGLLSWSPRHPIRTLKSMFGNLVNGLQSRRRALRNQSQGTQHLVAIATKRAS